MIYPAKPVSRQPELAIIKWAVWELPDGDRHLVGVIPESGYDGRVTSKIMEYVDRIVTTRSGRRYHLSGPPDASGHSEYVWRVWCYNNRIEPYSSDDVTAEYVVLIN